MTPFPWLYGLFFRQVDGTPAHGPFPHDGELCSLPLVNLDKLDCFVKFKLDMPSNSMRVEHTENDSSSQPSFLVRISNLVTVSNYNCAALALVGLWHSNPGTRWPLVLANSCSYTTQKLTQKADAAVTPRNNENFSPKKWFENPTFTLSLFTMVMTPAQPLLAGHLSGDGLPLGSFVCTWT